MWQTYITRWVTAVSLINHRASLLCDSLISQLALHYLANSVRELLNILKLLKLKPKSVKAISDKWSGLCPLSLPLALRRQSRRKSEGSGCETLSDSDARNRSEDLCWWSFWQQLYTNQGGCEVCECLREKSRSSFHKHGPIFPQKPPCGTDLSNKTAAKHSLMQRTVKILFDEDSERCLSEFMRPELKFLYEMVQYSPRSLRSGATLSKLRRRELGLRHEKKRPLTISFFQGWPRVNHRQWWRRQEVKIETYSWAKAVLSHLQDEVSSIAANWHLILWIFWPN